MENGNFLQLASDQLKADVGFGKMILIYADDTPIQVANLTNVAINTSIENGEIIGIIRNWHTVAGASVAETNVERPGSAEMKLIRPEILADTLSFESNIGNRAVLASLVEAGTVKGILLDDRGNVFGEESQNFGEIKKMNLNFSGKVSTGLQRDNTSDKMVSVTVRYLVKSISMAATDIEPEEINSKEAFTLKFVEVKTSAAGARTLVFKPIIRSTQSVGDFTGISDVDVNFNSFTENVAIGEFSIVGSNLELALTGTGLVVGTAISFSISISMDGYYSKAQKFTV